ncbi:adenylate kinase family protein [Mesomycoplasma hyorhinis]|uniref:Adenylate kinase n=4 Tax=Mesomycoplasma hyorhinis TaxID=2100 RepID=A0ABD6IEA5_MESHY|nr:nucleoside monophosphate kinase [Mesomycoplasma hyorhinis]AEC46340.1 adenylate kinase [Mesomycoplasma hyorhinis MCLD]AEX14166.1 adenylate kinase [Mesomycoplasma hyorhinis GDL-1]AFX74352.1 Adenylate kinase [Mesomycoplasma hyorhinis SK76]AOD25400.1 adenylate kinase [Mesomycoplasma hyorhinis]MXR06678.1 nucleoside monophosphate kinase [Mesomycoplasma hyorhinis]
MIKNNKLTNKALNLIFLGSPGSGKGTLAGILKEQKQILHLSTGDLFRAKIASDEEFALKMKQIILQGLYVPDEITNNIVLDYLQNANLENGIILDGYPRTITQAKFLEQNNFKIDFVVYLQTSENIILERLSLRKYCPTCQSTYHDKFKPAKEGKYCFKDNTVVQRRKDDEPEAIKKRIAIYQEQTAPLINYYATQNLLIEFDANQDLNKLTEEVITTLWKL